MARTSALDAALVRFAEELRRQRGASRVLLFGSQARGDALSDSDFDLIIVADEFSGVHPFERHFGIRPIWYAVGGDAPLDLICVTPQEFDEASKQITLLQAVLPEAIDLLTPVATSV